jgi:hypothetical protein
MNTTFGAAFSDELEKVACMVGGMDGGGSNWSDKFKDTPLAEAAINLELQQANSDLQFDEMESQKRQRDMQEGNIWDKRSQANDQFRVARKKMEMQLLSSQLQQAAGDREEGWQSLDDVQKPQAPPGQPQPQAPQPTQPGQPQQPQPAPKRGPPPPRGQPQPGG